MRLGTLRSGLPVARLPTVVRHSHDHHVVFNRAEGDAYGKRRDRTQLHAPRSDAHIGVDRAEVGICRVDRLGKCDRDERTLR